ncbi:MAG: hypothetical protein IJ458_04650 [Clostridia bacterium]|nr:hypothetical protein [Clostridia bacterium]
MLFYKFILRAGHGGGGKEQELTVFVNADSYFKAIKKAKNFPAAKHHAANVVISSNVVDEAEYLRGIMLNGYSALKNNEEDYINKLENIVRIISYLKDYKFETKEGQILNEYVSKYSIASNKEKELIERDYYNWAQNLINTSEMTC